MLKSQVFSLIWDLGSHLAHCWEAGGRGRWRGRDKGKAAGTPPVASELPAEQPVSLSEAERLRIAGLELSVSPSAPPAAGVLQWLTLDSGYQQPPPRLRFSTTTQNLRLRVTDGPRPLSHIKIPSRFTFSFTRLSFISFPVHTSPKEQLYLQCVYAFSIVFFICRHVTCMSFTWATSKFISAAILNSPTSVDKPQRH